MYYFTLFMHGKFSSVDINFELNIFDTNFQLLFCLLLVRPFVEARAAHHGVGMYEEIGRYKIIQKGCALALPDRLL